MHAHAVTQAGANAYTYDANGNMLAGGGRALTWDIHNRLVQVVDKRGTVSTYDYDGSGKRVKQVDGAVTTYYFGDALEMEYIYADRWLPHYDVVMHHLAKR